MRMNFKNILVAMSVLSVAISCVDDRDNGMVEDSFGFNNAVGENVVTIPIYGESYELAVIKSGKGSKAGVVNIYSSNSELMAYNEQHDTKYFPIANDGDTFSFSEENLSFSAEEVTKTVTINWSAAKVAAYMNKQVDQDNKYCIPVSLKSSDLEVNEGRNLFILNLVKSTITTEQRLFSKNVVFDAPSPVSETFYITANMDKAISGIDVTLNYEIDNELVAKYNQENGTEYLPAPEGLINLSQAPVIKAGEKLVQFPIEYNTAVLFGQDGTVTPFTGYVAPVRIKSTSVEGIVLGDVVTFFVVKGLEPVPPQLLKRVWGLYSVSSTIPWYGNLFERPSSGAPDRNMAMDDKYVYVSQSHQEKAVIKAFDINNPSNVVNVNTTGVSGGTHVISCVRVIPRNDGTGVLVATNLGSSVTLKLYAWTNGITNAPEVIQMENTWRRLGDKFTFRGTWEDGELWFMDWTEKRSTVVRFPIANGKITTWENTVGNGLWSPLGRWAIPFDQGTGMIGAMYAYPDAPLTEIEGNGKSVPSAIVTTTSGGWFWNITDSFVNMKIDCEIDPWTTDPQLALTFGYSFFTIRGKKYIAYTKLEQELGNKAELVVLNDPVGTHEGFKAALEAQDIAFSAPLQAEDASMVSPIIAENSVGDCCSFVINGKVHVAALLQGGGLSLFVEE